MPCPKPKPIICFLTNLLLVFIVCVVIDFLVYGLIFPGVNPYTQDLPSKLLFTLLLAAAFAHLYNKASIMWAPGSKLKFVYQNHIASQDDECKATWPKIANGMIFSALVSIVVFMCIILSGLFIAFLYIYILHGGHGDTLTVSTVTSVSGELIISGVVLEAAGKTEDDPRM